VPGGSGGRRLIASLANISTHDCGSSWLAAGARVCSPSLHNAGEVAAMRDNMSWCFLAGLAARAMACTKCDRIFLGADSGAELMFAETT
jgi:hypothetical protein